MAHSRSTPLRLETLEPRCLLAVELYPLLGGVYYPHGITIVPGDVERVAYSAWTETSLVLGQFCWTPCSGPGGHDDPVAVLDTKSTDAGNRIIHNYPQGGTVFLGETGLARLAAVSPERDVTVGGTQSPGCKSSAVQGLAHSGGFLWFADQGCNALGRVRQPGGRVEHFSLGPVAGGALGLAAASSGWLWLAEPLTQTVAAVIPDPAGIKVFRVDACDRVCVSPEDVAEGPDGTIWFTAPSVDDQDFIGTIGADGLVRLFPVPEPALLRGVAASYDALWFSDSFGRRLLRVSLKGEITEVPLLVDNLAYSPGPLAVGQYQDIWFVLPDDHALGRYYPDAAPGGGPAPRGDAGWLSLLVADVPSFAGAADLPPPSPAGQSGREAGPSLPPRLSSGEHSAAFGTPGRATVGADSSDPPLEDAVRNYSYRSASIGSSRDAFSAG